MLTDSPFTEVSRLEPYKPSTCGTEGKTERFPGARGFPGPLWRTDGRSAGQTDKDRGRGQATPSDRQTPVFLRTDCVFGHKASPPASRDRHLLQARRDEDRTQGRRTRDFPESVKMNQGLQEEITREIRKYVGAGDWKQILKVATEAVVGQDLTVLITDNARAQPCGDGNPWFHDPDTGPGQFLSKGKKPQPVT